MAGFGEADAGEEGIHGGFVVVGVEGADVVDELVEGAGHREGELVEGHVLVALVFNVFVAVFRVEEDGFSGYTHIVHHPREIGYHHIGCRHQLVHIRIVAGGDDAGGVVEAVPEVGHIGVEPEKEHEVASEALLEHREKFFVVPEEELHVAGITEGRGVDHDLVGGVYAEHRADPGPEVRRGVHEHRQLGRVTFYDRTVVPEGCLELIHREVVVGIHQVDHGAVALGVPDIYRIERRFGVHLDALRGEGAVPALDVVLAGSLVGDFVGVLVVVDPHLGSVKVPLRLHGSIAHRSDPLRQRLRHVAEHPHELHRRLTPQQLQCDELRVVRHAPAEVVAEDDLVLQRKALRQQDVRLAQEPSQLLPEFLETHTL